MSLQSIGVSLTGSFPQGMPGTRLMLENVRRLEGLGFDSVWSGDHIITHSPIMDAMTVLASFAAVTTRVQIGTAVYLMPLRHPVATAKQVVSLDLLSDGRFIFGVGVGGEIRREFEAVNVPVRERGRRTDEGLDILIRVLTQDHVTYAGTHYQLQDVTLAPRPKQQPYPPIWVGGRSDNALRRAARFANCWIGYLVSSARVHEAMQKIGDFAPTYERDPAAIQAGMLLFTALARDYETAKKMAVHNLSQRYNQPFDTLVDRYCIIGTPAQCLEKLQPYIEAGMSHLVFGFTCAPEQTAEQLEQCAAEVLPHLRQAAVSRG